MVAYKLQIETIQVNPIPDYPGVIPTIPGSDKGITLDTDCHWWQIVCTSQALGGALRFGLQINDGIYWGKEYQSKGFYIEVDSGPSANPKALIEDKVRLQNIKGAMDMLSNYTSGISVVYRRGIYVPA